MNPCRSIHACIGVLLLGGALPLRAEELKEIIVEADAEETVVPPHFAGSTTVIEGKTIAESGARSVAELLATRGGVRLSSSSGNSSGSAVHLRGFGENSSSRVLVLVDGRPLNRPDMGGVSWLEVPLARIERVEILRGSQTARFGDNAAGGVINLVTKEGGKRSTVIEAAGGSDCYTLARLSYQDTFAGKRIALDLERNYTDGWRQNAESELESAALRWSRDLESRAELEFGVSWANERNGFPGPLSKEQYLLSPRESIYELAGVADQYFSEQSRWGFDGNLILGKKGELAFEMPIAFTRRDQEWNFGAGMHADNLLQTFSAAPRLGAAGERWELEAGLQYRRDSLDVSQFAEIQRVNRTAQAELGRETLGVFASGEWEPWKNWHLGVSARWETTQVDASARNFASPANPNLNFDRENDEANRAWQIGLRWEPREDLSSWVRYDRLYRLPSTDEIASYQGYPLTRPFNDQLRAETGHNLELGSEWSPGDWRFRLNGFAQWLEGEIAFDYLQNLNVNLADTRRLGVESSIGYSRGIWEADLHYTNLIAEYEGGVYAGKQVYLVPRHELTARLACRPVEKVMIQGEYQYIGDAFEGNDFQNTREKLPSYGVANLLLRYEPKPGLSVYLRVNNLLDEHYATVKYSGVWYPASGRQFQLGIRREL
ncbi:TonB-dependent receptor [Luteolibacter sp. GHJ8]|uniref:TonB-dependent receptor n=1 Tax=Luteolibacter rhizosphaerae TaxID=2989719 RepID=A0ABT3FWI6_9BACT|nr:TonB-dependent receptor [Luteolibacter rhizosphaerae]MCW1911951.1 TonB-dependent receptor [Luteolibacter rhizosphaerae]